MNQYKQGLFFSHDFVGENSWNGYEFNCLMINVGGDQFVEAGRAAGGDSVLDGRGVAVADLDGDGRLDLVINNNNAAPTVYLNRLRRTGHWLALALRAADGAPDAVGTRLSLTVRQGSGERKTMNRWVEAGSGYAAQSDYPVHFGLGPEPRIEELEILWPSGRAERIVGEALRERLSLDRVSHLVEGELEG